MLLWQGGKVEIGRIALPLNTILALGGWTIVDKTYAADLGSITEELSKVKDKRSLIINFINDRLSSDFGKFFAKKAYFSENQLYFDGTLTEKVSYTP